MKYEVLEKKYTQKYTQSYIKAINEGCEKSCILGKEVEYRMNGKDSVITELSDLGVLLEYCLYPIFNDGDKTIGLRIQNLLKELVDSEDVICIYQVVKFIYIQDKFIKRYENLPLIINVKEIVSLLLEKIEKLSNDMKAFTDGEFALYPKNIYEMIQGMIKKSASFHQ